MNPDFTLIWPLSCLKDGDHLCCMKDLLRVGRFGPPFSSPQEPHCRDAVEGSSHV